MKTKNIIVSLLVITFLLPELALAETQMPQTMGEVQTLGSGILNKLPDAIKNVWQNQALPIWLNIWSQTKNIWQGGLGKMVGNWGGKIFDWVGIEKPDLKQEFQKEKQETQTDLWDKLLNLIK